MAYCEDCKCNVLLTIYDDWIGDPDVINGTKTIKVWECAECGGTNLSTVMTYEMGEVKGCEYGQADTVC